MAINQQPSALPTNSWDLTEPKDEIIEELYAIRDRYAAGFDYDLNRILADVQKREVLNQHRRADLKPLEPTAPND